MLSLCCFPDRLTHDRWAAVALRRKTGQDRQKRSALQTAHLEPHLQLCASHLEEIVPATCKRRNKEARTPQRKSRNTKTFAGASKCLKLPSWLSSCLSLFWMQLYCHVTLFMWRGVVWTCTPPTRAEDKGIGAGSKIHLIWDCLYWNRIFFVQYW